MKTIKNQLCVICMLIITIGLFTSCEKEDEIIIETPTINVTIPDINVKHASEKDLQKVIEFLDKKTQKSLVYQKSGGIYLETIFGIVYITDGLMAANEGSEGSISFNIIPKEEKENVIYNLVLTAPSSNGSRDAFIAKYVRDTSSTNQSTFNGTFERFTLASSLVNDGKSKMLDCPPDDIVTAPNPDDAVNEGVDDGINGNNSGSGGNSNDGTIGIPDGPDSTGEGIPTYTCYVQSMFIQCKGTNSEIAHSAEECGYKNNPTGSYYIYVYQCFEDSNRSTEKMGCPAVSRPSDPIIINDNTPILHQFTLLQLIGEKLTEKEKSWVKLIVNNPITIRLLGYIRDHDNSETSIATVVKVVKVLAESAPISSIDSIEDYKVLMSSISDGLNANPVSFNNPTELGTTTTNIDLKEALEDIDLSILSLQDWEFITTQALAVRDNVASLNSQYYDDSKIREITEDLASIVLLPNVKELAQDPAFYPQTPEEWAALGEIMKPLLLEIGLAFIPGADIIDVIQGLENQDYITVTIALAGLTVDAFGATLLKGIAKFGKVTYKSFKIARVVADFIVEVAQIIKKGFNVVYEGGVVILKKGENVIASGKEAIQNFAKTSAKLDELGLDIALRNDPDIIKAFQRIDCN